MWSKQFYPTNVARWLDGDPYASPPAASRPAQTATGATCPASMSSHARPVGVPWYAAWDLAFQTVSIAHVDPCFAKEQLLLLLREWYMHPNGQLPAYEWAFDDVNPPVHAWAALRVFRTGRCARLRLLARVLQQAADELTWWVNRKDAGGNNVFEGGFLGLDNVGPFDRGAVLPVSGVLEQSDGTAWMAMYALNMLEITLVLALRQPSYVDLATSSWSTSRIAAARYEQGLWTTRTRSSTT